jgi:hypothetical protein
MRRVSNVVEPLLSAAMTGVSRSATEPRSDVPSSRCSDQCKVSVQLSAGSVTSSASGSPSRTTRAGGTKA